MSDPRCFDPKHDEPCPLPCVACEEECDHLHFCHYCGAGPSKFMLGCCDDCSEHLAAETEKEV